MWLRKRGRVALGTELLAVQGLPFKLLKQAQVDSSNPFDHQRLVEMAGNAFSGFHMLPNMIAIFLHAPLRIYFATESGEHKGWVTGQQALWLAIAPLHNV